MLRSARALPRCISHSAHACTSFELVHVLSAQYAKIPTERTVRKNPITQIYLNTTSMANMRKQNVRTGMDKA